MQPPTQPHTSLAGNVALPVSTQKTSAPYRCGGINLGGRAWDTLTCPLRFTMRQSEPLFCLMHHLKVASRVLMPEPYMLEVVSDQSRNRACSALRLVGAVIAMQKSSSSSISNQEMVSELIGKERGERVRSGAAVSVPTFLSFQAHVTFLGLHLVTWGFGCLIAFNANGNYTCKSLCTGREMWPARPFCFVMFILSK